MRGRFVSILMSFLYAGYAQAHQCIKPKICSPKSRKHQIPEELKPLYKMFYVNYIPDIFNTLNANNDTGGNNGGSGNGGTGGVCGIEDPDNEFDLPDEEPYDCDQIDEEYDIDSYETEPE